MIKNVVVLCLILITFVSVSYASPRDADLVIEDIEISPLSPNIDDSISITAYVYNDGLKNTASFASIVTVGYFVDDVLLFVDNLGDLEPGLSNMIKLSSPPIWNAESGSHTVKVVVDLHDTLNDKFDSPDDNVSEKVFSVFPKTQTLMSVASSTQYSAPGSEYPTISISLVDAKTKQPLSYRDIEIRINHDDAVSSVKTDLNGKASFLPTAPLSDFILVESFFAGDDQYSSSHSSIAVYPLNEKEVRFIDPVDSSDSVYVVPSWIKTNAGWWADGSIDDASFVLSIQHLINEDIIQLSPELSINNESDTSSIPSWIKNNAGWWADGSIDDASFILGLQHLIQNGYLAIT